MMGEVARAFIEARIREEDRGHDSACWIWQRGLTPTGYAKAEIPGFGKNKRVHRASYELYVGPIPDGLTIDHLCRVPSCCNPAHLEPVTSYENKRRAGLVAEVEGYCIRGHVLAETKTKSGNCRACQRDRLRGVAQSPERRERKAAYMRGWNARNRDRILEQNRLRRAAKRATLSLGREADVARSLKFARHIAHDRAVK